VLTDAEIKAAVDLTFNGPRTLIELIEQTLLLEIDRRISGTSTADMTIAESRLVEALTTVTMQQQCTGRLSALSARPIRLARPSNATI
jgi:hypothetical protein